MQAGGMRLARRDPALGSQPEGRAPAVHRNRRRMGPIRYGRDPEDSLLPAAGLVGCRRPGRSGCGRARGAGRIRGGPPALSCPAAAAGVINITASGGGVRRPWRRAAATLQARLRALPQQQPRWFAAGCCAWAGTLRGVLLGGIVLVVGGGASLARASTARLASCSGAALLVLAPGERQRGPRWHAKRVAGLRGLACAPGWRLLMGAAPGRAPRR